MKPADNGITIRHAIAADLPRIVSIYNSSILLGNAVADEAPIEVEGRAAWFNRHAPHRHPLWVLLCEGTIAGWLSVQPYYSDPAFVKTAEVSIHIAPEHQNMGFGTLLLVSLVKECPVLGISTLLGFALADNVRTRRINQRAGLRAWGHLPKVAVIGGRRCDLVIYGINIEETQREDDLPVMSPLDPGDANVSERDLVATHYDSSIEREAVRLEKHSAVEFAITLRHLTRWIPPASVVVDIGVGVGHYARALAERGCSLHLCDISRKLLDAAVSRLRGAGLIGQVIQARQVSAVSVDCVEDASCDAALLLGPLYHLVSKQDRTRAIMEVVRMLKPGGMIFAAGINRLAYFKDLLRSSPSAIIPSDFHWKFLRDGALDRQHAPEIGRAYLTTVQEFRSEFAGSFAEIAVLGVESFADEYTETFTRLNAEERESWLELIEATAASLEGCASASHFLFIGRKV
jgi:phosphinothricin acetyltransferase